MLPHYVVADVAERRGSELARLERRLADWPVPSIARIHRTWLADGDARLLLGETAMLIDSDGGEVDVPAPPLDAQGRLLSSVGLGDVADAYPVPRTGALADVEDAATENHRPVTQHTSASSAAQRDDSPHWWTAGRARPCVAGSDSTTGDGLPSCFSTVNTVDSTRRRVCAKLGPRSRANSPDASRSDRRAIFIDFRVSRIRAP
jgi:hypothetical protein